MGDVCTRANVPHGTSDAQYSLLRRLTPVPLAAGSDPDLTVTALRLLINTSGYSTENGWCWLTQQQLANLSHVHRNTIHHAQRHLMQKGYLEVAHNLYDAEQHRKRQTVYRVTEPPITTATE